MFLVIVSCYCRVYTWDIWRGGAGPGPSCRSTVQVDFGNICALQGTVPYIVQRESVPIRVSQFWSVLLGILQRTTHLSRRPTFVVCHRQTTHLCRLP